MKIKVVYQKRKCVEGEVPNYTIYFNGMSMVVDECCLPPKLYRLLPPAHGHCKSMEWYPFCVMAVALKLMK